MYIAIKQKNQIDKKSEAPVKNINNKKFPGNDKRSTRPLLYIGVEGGGGTVLAPPPFLGHFVKDFTKRVNMKIEFFYVNLKNND